MSSKDEPNSKSLSSDQVALIVEVVRMVEVKPTTAQWEEISAKLGATNGKAVTNSKERFRYLMASLENTAPRKKGTPRAPAKAKTATPALPPSTNMTGSRKRGTGHFEDQSTTPSKKPKTGRVVPAMLISYDADTDGDAAIGRRESFVDELKDAKTAELTENMDDEEFDDLVNKEV